MKKSLFTFALAGLALSIQAADPVTVDYDGISVGNYRGWKSSVELTAEDADVTTIVVPAVGGRICFYGVGRDNVIWENQDTFGKTLSTEKKNFQVGGYQIDIGPELRGIPRHKVLWMGEHDHKLVDDYTIETTSAKDPAIDVQLSKRILLDPETGDLGITQTLKNTSDSDVSYCMWDRTLVQGGGYAMFKLNNKSQFKKKWAVRSGDRGKWFYDGDNPDSDQVKLYGNLLVAHCEGPATKIGADTDEGWIAYAWRKYLFVKYFPVYPDQKYTDGGCRVELYFNERFGELEPLSPEVKLAPGESYQFPEFWKIIELKKEIHSHSDARKAAKLIPDSPFGR